ncbi:caspase family protein [Lyngbya aestuarii]|uniref:caspase family protein n=1 Tax=Lyngbya aestuarii TaxID=118322 RepID=UPI00403DD689
MSHISRRQFCLFTGATLASLGLGQFKIKRQAQNYGKVLAQSTPCKLALLVGINQYSSQPLRGCLNDLELQRYLLIHRFGFNPQDIYTLTDEQATRQGILEAFEEHLIKQAKPEDVVVYHYSGHGSRVLDPEPIIFEPGQEDNLNGTFVPVDSSLPTGYPEQSGTVEDIMGHTLFLLMSALPSENFTAVLDSCFSGAATRKFTVRARDGGSKVLISPQEKEYQEKWLSRLGWSREEFVSRYRQGVAKGVVLAATDPTQYAIDASLNGFYAGAFTYLLTSYLWQEDATPESAIAYAVKQIPEEFNQTPTYEVNVGSNYEDQPMYFLGSPSSEANAVITEVKGDRAEVWLGGVDLATVDQGTVFSTVDGSGQLRFVSRDGLVGEVVVEGKVEPGTLLRKEN